MLCTCKSYKIKWEWEFAMACPRSGSSSTVSRFNWNLEMLVFMEGGKPENSAKNLRSKERTNNKLNPHITPGPGIEPRPHRWETSALTTAPHMLPFLRKRSHNSMLAACHCLSDYLQSTLGLSPCGHLANTGSCKIPG